MAITVTGLKIELTPEPSGKGSSAVNPYRFADLLVAAPNIVEIISTHRITRKFYYVPYALYVQSGAYFDISYEMILFGGDVDYLGNRIYISNTGYMKVTNSLLRCNNSEFSTLNNISAENSTFIDFRGLSIYKNSVFRKCKFVNVGSTYWSNSATNQFIDCDVSNTLYGNIPRNNIIDIRNKFLNCTTGLLAGYNTSGDIKIYNSSFIDCTNDIAYQPLATTHYTTRLIDPLLDLNKQSVWGTSANRQMTLEIATLMSLILNNADGADITIYDKDNNVHYQGSYSNGFEEEIVYYKRYVLASGINGQPTTDTINIYQPFKVVISKNGYDDLVINNLEVTPGQATTLRGELVPLTPPIYYNQQLEGTINTDSVQSSILSNTVTGTVNNSIISGTIVHNQVQGTISSASLAGDIY